VYGAYERVDEVNLSEGEKGVRGRKKRLSWIIYTTSMTKL